MNPLHCTRPAVPPAPTTRGASASPMRLRFPSARSSVPARNQTVQGRFSLPEASGMSVATTDEPLAQSKSRGSTTPSPLPRKPLSSPTNDLTLRAGSAKGPTPAAVNPPQDGPRASRGRVPQETTPTPVPALRQPRARPQGHSEKRPARNQDAVTATCPRTRAVNAGTNHPDTPPQAQRNPSAVRIHSLQRKPRQSTRKG